MLIIVCIILLVVTVSIYLDCENKDKPLLSSFALVAIAVLIVTCLCMLIMMISYHATAVVDVQCLYEKQLAIEYEIEKSTMEDDPTQMIRDICEFNTQIYKGQYWQRNFWVGFIFPDIYDDFDIFNYEGDME